MKSENSLFSRRRSSFLYPSTSGIDWFSSDNLLLRGENASNHSHITPCLGLKPIEKNKQSRICQGQQSKENPTVNMQQRKIKHLLNRNICIVLNEEKKEK